MQQRFTPSAPSLVTIIRTLANVTLTSDQLNKILELTAERDFIAAANYMIINNLTNNTSTYIIDTLSQAKNNTGQQLLFPVSIAAADDDQYIITSNEFTFNGQNCIIRNKLSSNTLQIVTSAGGNVINDNVGSFNAIAGTVTINYFNPTSISRSQSQIKLSAVPANQSVIDPTRNERLVYDPDRSVITTVLTEATN